MSADRLGQYFRSFLVKLCMIDSQLGVMDLNGKSPQSCVLFRWLTIIGTSPLADDITFAIVLELKDGQAPSSANEKVNVSLFGISNCN